MVKVILAKEHQELFLGEDERVRIISHIVIHYVGGVSDDPSTILICSLEWSDSSFYVERHDVSKVLSNEC